MKTFFINFLGPTRRKVATGKNKREFRKTDAGKI